MKLHFPTSSRAASVTLALVLSALTALPLLAQARSSRGSYHVPMTAFGQPDLQGNWTNKTLTPLQRPRGRNAVLTPAQVDSIESGQAQVVENAAQPIDPDRPLPPGGDNPVCIDSGTTCYDEVYRDPGSKVAVVNGEARSSIVTDPSDGRVPALTSAAVELLRKQREFNSHFGAADNPENRPLSERCVISFGSSAGPPMLPNYWYNNNYTIVQNAGNVLIMTEMEHDARVIHLGEPHRLPKDVKPYFGDSWGHWEGNTLVIETTNINPEQTFQGLPLSDQGKITERLTRVADDTILYQFTVDDPAMYTRSWGGELPFVKMDDLIYEYACHEGNYSLEGVLRGARYEESQQAAESPSKN
jgi:hypothetical protein